MRFLIGELKGRAAFFLLAILLMVSFGARDALAGWFTNPGGGSGGFTGRPLITVELYVDNDQTTATMPANLAGLGPNPGLPYTKTLTAVVRQDGRLYPAEQINFDLAPSLAQGALYDPADLTKGYRAFPVEKSSGIATMFFHASSTPGDVVITASAQDPNTRQTVSASIKIKVVAESRPAAALTFTGSYVNAVIAGESRFGSADGTPIKDGSYSRIISVVVNDQNGNPTNPNTQVNFYLVDGPLTGYPSTPGAFFVAGSNADPAEGQFSLKALNPPGNFMRKGVQPYQRLILDGRQNNNEPLPNNSLMTGVWSVQSVLSDTELTVTGRAFNQGGNNGATVPYIIGRAENGAVLSPAFTGVDGVASTVLTYPVERVGQTAVVMACIEGTSTCGILNTCDRNGTNCNSVYLGVTNGADRTLTVSATSLKPNSTTDVQMCLRDANFTPLPATEIRYDIGAKGQAKVKVNGKEGTPGKVMSGANGCATVTISSSGQIPGSEEIPLLFTADYVVAPATVTIRSPGAGKLEGLFNCKNTPAEGTGRCEGTLRLTDDEGSPIPDMLIGVGDVVAAGEFTLTFNPAEGNFGKTDDTGQVQVVVDMKMPGQYAFPFQTSPGGTATYTLNMTVTAPGTLEVTILGSTDASTGVPYSAAFLANGGVPPYTWTLLNGALPPGLSLSANGSVSGIPTQEGSFSFAVQVKDKNGLTGTGAFTITVGEKVTAPLEVVLGPTQGAVGTPFNGVVSASGGKEPYSFQVLAGSLPPGLSLSSTGTLSGTPSAVGTFAFSIKASDSKGATGTGNFIITIGSASPVTVKLEGGGAGQVGKPFADGTVNASGGTPPYTFREIGNVLALSGLTLNSSTGAISGTPTQSGTFTFTVEATDKNGLNGVGSLKVTIEPAGGSAPVEPLTVQTNELKANAGTPYSAMLGTASGGKAPYTWSIESRGNLPDGIQLSSGGVLSGTFGAEGTYNFVVKVTDSGSPAQIALTNASVVVGAGGGGGGGGGTADPAQLTLLASSPDLPSSGQNPVTLTAVARDKGGVLLEGVTVNFRIATGDGAIQVVRAVTDETGTAQALLTTGGDKHNRSITVGASAGAVESNTVTVQVVGTTLNVSGVDAGAAVLVGDTRTLIFELKDSAGQGIAGEILDITSALNGLALPPATSSEKGSTLMVTTNASGLAEVQLTINQNGQDTINALWDEVGAATTTTLPLTLNASPDSFTIVVTDDTTRIEDNVGIAPASFGEVVVTWLTDGQPVAGGTVVLRTTKGTFNPSDAGSGGTIFTGVTDASGKVNLDISSTVPGDALITATGKKGSANVSAQKQIHFVATNPTQMTLQAQPATIAVNVPPSTSSQSTITATLRDANDNPVANQDVVFTIMQDPSGGTLNQSIKTTGFDGRASVTYTAGSISTQENGVVIKATAGSQSVDVRLTVSKREVFITLGTGNTVTKPDPTTYALPYSVLVTDIVGGPVPSAVVTLDSVPQSYSKGQYAWNGTVWVPIVTATCTNEDTNSNGILDPGEDTNNNGVLDPGNVVTTSVSAVTTGNDGFGLFEVRYAQQYANWISNQLTARTKVGGSEDTEYSYFTLPVAAEDVKDEKVYPPGQPSPFGVLPQCAISTQAESGLVMSADPNPLVITVGAPSLGPNASVNSDVQVTLTLPGSTVSLTGATVIANTSEIIARIDLETSFSKSVTGNDVSFNITATNNSLTQSIPVSAGGLGTQVGSVTFQTNRAKAVVPVYLRQ